MDGEVAAKQAARTAARTAGHADLAALIGIPEHACIIAPPTDEEWDERLGPSPALAVAADEGNVALVRSGSAPY